MPRKSERSLVQSIGDNEDANLQKRANNEQPYMSRTERETARQLALGLHSQITRNDLVLFIGNSARYA